MSNDTGKLTLDDIVFENRNKEYGAYFLRKNYVNHLNRAMVVGVSIFTLIFGVAWTYQRYVVTDAIVPERVVEYKPIDYKEPETAKPVVEQKEIQKSASAAPQIKYIVPEAVSDQTLTEASVPTTDQLNGAVISNETVEGKGEATAFTTVAPVVAERPKEAEPVVAEDNLILVNVEKLPEFPGGMSEMYKFINAHIKYPSAAQRGNISGRVFLKFVVEKDGSIGSIEIMKGIGFGCDEEASRVIKSMPKWSPARQNGKSVRVYYTMPVFYRLE